MRKRSISSERPALNGLKGSGLLVVVELGGEWPGLMQADASARRVVTQHEGETPSAFADRVAASLDSLFGRGIKLTTVALACNERIDPVADAARRKFGSLVLGTMAKHKEGRFYFTASPLSSGRLHHALSALARALFDEWRTAGLEVSVEFGDERGSATSAAALSARVA
jgi:hypothetical protein